MQLLASLSRIRSAQTTKTDADKQSKYRAVEVITKADSCCGAVQATAGKRFLSDEVPALPVADCDAGECKCSYRLFDDRRAGNRRGSGAASDSANQYREQDHRLSALPGRRSDDLGED
jgi:hypothetical protein